jgi:hypothetical protein
MSESAEELLQQMKAKWALQDAERKQEREARRGLSEKEKDPKESSELFLADFNQDKSDVIADLASLCSQPPNSSEPKTLQDALDAITTRVFQASQS